MSGHACLLHSQFGGQSGLPWHIISSQAPAWPEPPPVAPPPPAKDPPAPPVAPAVSPPPALLAAPAPDEPPPAEAPDSPALPLFVAPAVASENTATSPALQATNSPPPNSARHTNANR